MNSNIKHVICDNNHHYDANRFSCCPVCGSLPVDESPVVDEPKEEEKKPKRIVFGGRKRKKDPPSKVEIIPVSNESGDVTFGRYGVVESKSTDPEEEVVEEGENGGAISSDESGDIATDGELEAQPIPEEKSKERKSLKKVVIDAKYNDDGKTKGYFSSGGTAHKGEPVVGWLVCVHGKHFGESFEIFAGRNSVGREIVNNIALVDDDTVSREKHAWIIYEPKKKEFFVQPGESRGLTYVNDDMVMESRRLAMKDEIGIGDEVLVLIPLCGESFSWDNYVKGEAENDE